jgi:hypothetical protein
MNRDEGDKGDGENERRRFFSFSFTKSQTPVERETDL